jgi:hypothetical protein
MSPPKRRGEYRPPRDRRDVAIAITASLTIVVVTAVLIWVLRPNKDSGSSPPTTSPAVTTTVPAATVSPTDTTAPNGGTTPTDSTAATAPPETTAPDGATP